MKPIRVRFIVEVELAKGTTFVDAAEVSESVSATLLQNIEVKTAELVAIEKLPAK